MPRIALPVILLAALLAGCTETRESAYKMSAYGFQAEYWDVTRIEQHPDPLRMQATILTKYRCTSQIPAELWVEGQSRFYNCHETMQPQAFTQPGWFVTFLQPAMIAAGIWAAGHEIGGMSPDRTSVNQQASQNVRFKGPWRSGYIR